MNIFYRWRRYRRRRRLNLKINSLIEAEYIALFWSFNTKLLELYFVYIYRYYLKYLKSKF